MGWQAGLFGFPPLHMEKVPLCPVNANLLLDTLPTNGTVGEASGSGPIMQHDWRVLVATPITHDKMTAGQASRIGDLRITDFAI